MKSLNQTNEPTQVEQLAANAEMALSLLGQAIGQDYSHIEAQIVQDYRQYEEQQPKLDGHEVMTEYAKASGKGAARRIVEANKNVMPEMEAMNQAVANLGSDWFSFTNQDEEKAVF